MNEYTKYTVADDHLTILSEVVTYEPPEITTLSEQAAGYRRDINGIVRSVWNSTMAVEQGFELFEDSVRFHLTRAWYAGAKECGISPNELSLDERNQLRSVIASETARIFSFLLEVEEGNKAAGVLFGRYRSRVDTWALRYPDVQNRARVMACGDKKLEWVINYTRNVKNNCSSCMKLSGKVKRGSTWQRLGIQPQNPPNDLLVCQGWLCGCALVPTDKPMSKGPLPKLP